MSTCAKSWMSEGRVPMLKGAGLFSEEYGTIFCHDSASSQYDTRVCITLCHPSNNAGHNAIQLKDSLRFLPLCCTHAGHRKVEYFHLSYVCTARMLHLVVSWSESGLTHRYVLKTSRNQLSTFQLCLTGWNPSICIIHIRLHHGQMLLTFLSSWHRELASS